MCTPTKPVNIQSSIYNNIDSDSDISWNACISLRYLLCFLFTLRYYFNFSYNHNVLNKHITLILLTAYIYNNYYLIYKNWYSNWNIYHAQNLVLRREIVQSLKWTTCNFPILHSFMMLYQLIFLSFHKLIIYPVNVITWGPFLLNISKYIILPSTSITIYTGKGVTCSALPIFPIVTCAK